MSEQFMQEEAYEIDTLEAVKILSDPMRHRLLEYMLREPITVKQIAEKLDIPPKRLYYHVNLLEKHGLIFVADTQVVSGIIEKWYLTRARSFSVKSDLFKVQGEDEDETYSSLTEMIDSVFEGTRRAISALLSYARQHSKDTDEIHPDLKQIYMLGSHLHLSPEKRDKFTDRLSALIKEFKEDSEQNDPDLPEFGLTISFYPRVPTKHYSAQFDDNSEEN